eukprot:13135-Heterococcus_DN1.PRE.4
MMNTITSDGRSDVFADVVADVTRGYSLSFSLPFSAAYVNDHVVKCGAFVWSVRQSAHSLNTDVLQMCTARHPCFQYWSNSVYTESVLQHVSVEYITSMTVITAGTCCEYTFSTPCSVVVKSHSSSVWYAFAVELLAHQAYRLTRCMHCTQCPCAVMPLSAEHITQRHSA